VALPARGVLEIRSSDSEHVIAAYNPLALSYFSRPPTDGELALLRRMANEARGAAISGGMLFVIARRNMTGGIDPRVREFFEQLVKEHSDRAGASAAVILMQGFGGSLMRSFLTSLLLVGGKRKLLQIFASVDVACRWLGPHHGLDAAALLGAYEQATKNIPR
jgi:hypothetical protein